MGRMIDIATPIVLLMTVVACAAPPAPTPSPSRYPPTASFATGGRPKAEERARLVASQERRLEKRRQELVEGVRVPLAEFVAEPPGSCRSSNLRRAVVAVDEYSGFATRRNTLKYLAESAGLILDLADAAADRDCPEFARALYRAVITTYIGTGYVAHRQRAEIGLVDLRARGI